MFAIETSGLRILDSYANGGGKTLVRSVKATGTAGQPVDLLLVRGLPVAANGSNTFLVDGRLTLTIDASEPARLINDRTLALPISSTPATIRYSWR